MTKENTTKDNQAKWNPKRIAALIAVILLVGLYLVTFIVAVFVPVEGNNLFAICLMGTIAIPLLAWVYIWMYGQMTGKETIADLKILQTGPYAEEATSVETEDAEKAEEEK